jgi:hypothetical protein
MGTTAHEDHVSYLAIGAVTRALTELLARKLNNPPLMGTTQFRVTTLPPDDDRVSDETGINLFLYKVTESPMAKNMDWRGDRVTPVNGRKPPLALSLSYMITAYAKKTGGTAQDDISTQQLLGNAMAVFHQFPVLNDIHDSDFDADVDTQFAPELRNAFEKVKVTLLPISMEEFSKIWTGFSKAYRLSVAYEVSLIEIGPLTAATTALSGPVQRIGVRLGPTGAPAIAAVQPATGPAGAQVTILGANFRLPGGPTTVTIGDQAFEEADLLVLTPQEIQVAIPAAPLRGPKLAIVVAAGGAVSAPATYTVVPWIDAVVPLRGITGIGVTVPFQPPPGATISAEVDGQAVAATLDPSGKSVQTVIPLTITSNGPKPVVLLVNGVRSNARLFEVLPLIQSASIATQTSPANTMITLNGERLNGQDITVLAGDLRIAAAANTNAAQLVAQIGRVLAADLPVSAVIDARQSNVVPPRLDSIEPALGGRGEEIALIGAGLSGRNVSVSFGPSTVQIGAQPFATRVKTAVPAGAAVGTIQVTVTVDGRNTGSVAFQVMS